jgi:hypothetical protein
MGRVHGFSRSRAARLGTTLAVLWFGWVGVPPANAGGAVLVGAGDISECHSSGDSATAKLVDSIGGTVFTLGDHAYDDATSREFKACYDRTWGRFKGRTRPTVGNHEYHSKWAKAYWQYFGRRAGSWGKGWYSYDAGDWHVVVLNSICYRVSCHKGSEQERWLRADLARHDNKCTLAYWHIPRFSSDREHGNNPDVGPFWEALYDYGADLVLGAHAHSYERFAPMNPDGKADPKHGLRQIVVGTGGAGSYRLGGTRPNSQVRNDSTYGVLKLDLHSDSYEWKFVPVAGERFKDSGRGSCHGRP